MTVPEIREMVVNRLPDRYEHLKLTFYGPKCRQKGDHVIIGDDYGTDLCVSLSEGAVYSIDPQEKLPTRFINSSIPQLVDFIDVSESFSHASVKDAEALAQQMREALTRIDPKAFANLENWWAVILEQIAHEL